jgi:hypothetical protein
VEDFSNAHIEDPGEGNNEGDVSRIDGWCGPYWSAGYGVCVGYSESIMSWGFWLLKRRSTRRAFTAAHRKTRGPFILALMPFPSITFSIVM